jgi:hypothetical protein
MPALSAAATPHSDMDSPAPGGCCLPTSAGGSGSASITATMPSDVERRLCEWTRVLLIRDLRHAKKDHRATCLIRKALAAATLGALR